MSKRPYHHGNLREALVAGSFDLLAADGLAAFSVARLARALGVSTAAPYRHFRDRDDLLAAVAVRAAGELTAALRAATADRSDPEERFVAATGAYVRFVAERGVGYPVIFAPELRPRRDGALAAAGRELMDLLLDLATATGPRDPAAALDLLERQVALAHGYLTLHGANFLRPDQSTSDALVTRAEAATHALLRGSRP